MTILPQPLAHTLHRVAADLLPGSCLLCGADSRAGLLCPACAADLPPLPAACCPQCGEATTHGERCGACLKEPPAFDNTLALFRYEFPVDRLIQALKYGHQLALAAWFGECLAGIVAAAGHDLLLPLPLHPDRLRERGFNQSAEIARRVARVLGTRTCEGAVQRSRDTRPQVGLRPEERRQNIDGAFVASSGFRGLRVAVVDDVLTTGATVGAVAAALRQAGAISVDVWCVARAAHKERLDLWPRP